MGHLRRVLVDRHRDFPVMGVLTTAWCSFPEPAPSGGAHVWLGQRFCTDGRSSGGTTVVFFIGEARLMAQAWHRDGTHSSLSVVVFRRRFHPRRGPARFGTRAHRGGVGLLLQPRRPCTLRSTRRHWLAWVWWCGVSLESSCSGVSWSCTSWAWWLGSSSSLSEP